MNYHYEAPDGTRYMLELLPQPDGSYQAILGARTYTVHLLRYSNGELRFTLDEQPIQVAAVAQHGTRYLAYQGQRFQLEKTTSATRTAVGSAHSGDLTAAMPGQIIAVQVAEGDAVEKGQTLLVMEAMKMEMRIKAPSAGIVKKLLCSVGDTVERGQGLVEVEAG